MNVGAILKRSWRWTLAFVQLLGWMCATTWLGVRFIVQCGVVLAYLDELTAETLPCPRGHAVPVFGIYECRCGSRHEGWAFGRCAVCGQSAAWTPCWECGLPVLNPLRRFEL